jgi:hypothetical protein
MQGALLVIFFCVIMPISLIFAGLKFGWPYACYLQENVVEVWDRWFPPKIVPPARKTLDELGRTMEEESNKYYDGTVLEKIKRIHAEEHSVWDSRYNGERKRQNG